MAYKVFFGGQTQVGHAVTNWHGDALVQARIAALRALLEAVHVHRAFAYI